MGLYKQKFNPVSSQFDLVISEADFNSKADLSYVDAQGKNLILNAMLNAFRIAQIGALTILKMVDGFMDEYEDESGINLPSSSGFFYDAVNDFFKPAFIFIEIFFTRRVK